MPEDRATFRQSAAKAAEYGSALQRILKLTGEDADLTTVLGKALDAVLDISWLSILPKAGVFLVEEPGGSLRLAAERALGPEIRSRCATVKFGHCLCGRAALTRQTQHAACVDARHETRFDGMKPHGHYNVPIKSQGALLGVLVVYLPEHHGRDEEEVEFLESFADALAMLILSRKREEALQTARMDLERALSDANSLMDVINSNMIVSKTTRSGTIVSVNQAFCDISGFSREELLGRQHSVLNSGEHSREFWNDFWRTIVAGDVWRGEICNRRKDGAIYWVDSIVFGNVDTDGRVEGYTSIRIDVTERKKAESSISHLGRILDSSSNEIYIANAETLVLTQANYGACLNTGYSQDELTSLTAYDINSNLTPESFAEVAAPLRDGSRSKVTLESVHRRKDGSEYPVEITLHLAHDETPPVFVAIVNDITDRQRTAARIRELAFFDSLTNLPNRALLMDRLKGGLARAERSGEPLKLLFLDLDRFKEINDTRGHAVGDAVLREVAARFAAQLRESETLARLGGDEFVAILENADYADAHRVIERLRTALKLPISVDGKAHMLGVSVGVASFPEDGDQAELLLRRSDIAMYEAKSNLSAFSIYDAKMERRLEKRLETAKKLAHAVENDILELNYQPIVSLEDGRVLGAEALLRWTDSEWGAVSPGEFIPVAQERLMMSHIGAWVVSRACRQLHEWDQNGLAFPGKLAVNLDAQEIADHALFDRLSGLLARNHIDPTRMELEITESCMMADRARAAETVGEIKSLGLSIAVDDFGTGYSSLAYLREFKIDKLKIDMSFVHALSQDPNTHPIVEATIAMANSLGLKVVAEGIETAEQAALLQSFGCLEGQGYYFGKPLDADSFARRWLTGRIGAQKVPQYV